MIAPPGVRIIPHVRHSGRGGSGRGRLRHAGARGQQPGCGQGNELHFHSLFFLGSTNNLRPNAMVGRFSQP